MQKIDTQQVAERLRDSLLPAIRELVNRPGSVEISATVSDGQGTIVLTVRTAPGEVGQVIGRAGKNVHALRTLLEAIAAKYRHKAVLEIADDTKRS